MKFTDLTISEEKNFVLDQPGKQVFFLHNISGEFTFEINAPGAEICIFALFTGKDKDAFELKIRQIHNASQTISHATIAYLGDDESILRYEGLIHIDHNATHSEASQKNTNLLLSNKSQAFSIPSLEILTDDVICHHGATTSRINPDHLFYAQSRGIDTKQAQEMIAEGFINDFFGTIEKLDTFPEIENYKESTIC